MYLLKRLLLDCGIVRRDFCRAIKWGETRVSKCLNHGEFPSPMYPGDPRTKEEFMRRCENFVVTTSCTSAWLISRGMEKKDIWKEYDGKIYDTNAVQARHTSYGMAPMQGMELGDPLYVKQHTEGIEMITSQALKFFRLFRNPFINEVLEPKDIFFSEDHIFLKEMMLDTARFSGFTAVFGEVGSGKSIMRKAVVQELINEQIKVIYPIIVDKSRITPASLIDAIVMDISEEAPKRSLEAKTRQALRLLKNRATSGLKQCLIIEEAHLLSVKALKSLKQIAELENGFERLVGIILIGQPELKYLLDETQKPEMREVIRRITCAEISGIGADLPRYLAHKFFRMNKKVDELFTKDSLEAMQTRLQDRSTRGKTVSKAYPLSINNLAARAMNLAADMGEKQVTGDVVMGC